MDQPPVCLAQVSNMFVHRPFESNLPSMQWNLTLNVKRLLVFPSIQRADCAWPGSICLFRKVEFYQHVITLSPPVLTTGSRKAVSCLCDNACKRSPATCHKSRASWKLLSVPYTACMCCTGMIIRFKPSKKANKSSCWEISKVRQSTKLHNFAMQVHSSAGIFAIY